MEPRVTIDEKGMTFRANGREIKPSQVEYALTFMGQSYDGIMAVFFPFPVSNNDFGRVLMYVNDDEKRGVIRFESDLPRGRSEEHTSELQSLMRNSYAVFCLQKKIM